MSETGPLDRYTVATGDFGGVVSGTYPDAGLPQVPPDAEHWQDVRRLAISLLRIADRELGLPPTIPERVR